MKIIILTLFPKMFEGFLSESIIGRAQKDKKIEIEIKNLRDWGIGKHKQVDDTPYGGGVGMVLRPDVVAKAILDTKLKIKNKKLKIVLLTPQGTVFSQKKAQELSAENQDLLLVCGHYEGFDERIRDYVDEEISIGDFVLTGGEIAAAAVTDAIVRLLPGVLGKEESHQNESFSINKENKIENCKLKIKNLLEYPHYTRPELFEGKSVPKVLLSGNHAKIEEWRHNQSLQKTKNRRPDLLINKTQTSNDKQNPKSKID